MSLGSALLLLFVVVPVVLAVAVIALVQWRAPEVPAEHLTSELLRDGTRANGTLVEWHITGQSFLDRRPMVDFRVAVREDEPELSITQSVPRDVLNRMKPGMPVEVRLSEDGSAGALVLDPDVP